MRALIVDKSALKNNIAQVKQRAGKAVIYAVLTGDGYGAGTVELARALRADGISHFAVTEPADAALLRHSGFEQEHILMLRSITGREELERLMDLNVIFTVGSYETAMALNSVAEGRATIAEAHVQIDTGMGFGGFLSSEPDKLLSVYQYLPNVAISGTYTQFHAAGGDIKPQLDEFLSTVEKIRSAGFDTGILHAAGSSVLMSGHAATLDGVRVGSAFLGRCRRTKGDELQTVGWGEASLDSVRWLPKGHTVGNEVLVTLTKPTRVAVLPVGHQNGMGVFHSRQAGLWAALKAWWEGRHMTVRVNGQKARVLGRPGAVETVVDVTDIKCAAGDVAAFSLDPMFARGLEREYR